MKKSISIVIFFTGIFTFIGCVASTSSTSHKHNNEVNISLPEVIIFSEPTPTTSDSNESIPIARNHRKSHSTSKKVFANHKTSKVIQKRIHILEQGGSPEHPTVVAWN